MITTIMTMAPLPLPACLPACRYHRALGRMSWLLVTGHMLMWQIKWAMEGTLWNNVTTINNLTISNANLANTAGDPIHDDNFTIVIAQLVGRRLRTPIRHLSNRRAQRAAACRRASSGLSTACSIVDVCCNRRRCRACGVCRAGWC